MAVTQKRKDELAERLRKKREASAFKQPEPTSRIKKTLTREEKIGQMKDLRLSAKRSGVLSDQAGKRDERVAPPSRFGSAILGKKLETDLDRRQATLETAAAQGPIELEKKIIDQKRDIQRRRDFELQQIRNQRARDLEKARGIKEGSLTVDAEGNIGVNLGNLMKGVQFDRVLRGTRMGFEFTGNDFSSDPDIAEAQRKVAQASFTRSANEGTLRRELEGIVKSKLGVSDFRETELPEELQQQFAAEEKQTEFLFSRAAAQPTGTPEQVRSAESNFATALRAMNARRAGIERQTDEALSQEILNIRNESDRRRRTRKARVETSSLEAQREIERQIDREEDKIVERKTKEVEESIASVKDKAFADLEGDFAQVRADFEEQGTKSLSERKEDEKIAFIEREQAKDSTLTTAYLANKFDAMNKYDAASDENSRVGQVVDSVLGGPEPDSAKFAAVNEETGDIDDAYKALKSRVGEFKAKQMQQAYLESKGWDDLTINSHNYAQDFLDLYNGDETSVAALADFVTRSQKMNIPDEYIAARLDLLKTNPAFDREVLELYTRGLVPAEKPIAFGNRLLRVTPDGVEVLASKAGPVQRSTSPSSLTGAVNAPVSAESVGSPVGLTEEQILAADPEAAAWAEDLISGLESTRSITQTGNLRNRAKQMEKQIIGLREESGLGNERFYKMDAKERQKLADFYKVRGMIQRIRELREGRNLGPIASRSMRTSIKSGFVSDQEFSELDQLTQKRLAEFMKDISGAAVSDQEVARLSRIIPNVLMQDSEFDSALNTMEREFDEILRTKLNTFGFRDEQNFVNLFSGKDISLLSGRPEEQPVTEGFMDMFNQADPELQEQLKNDPEFSHLFQ